ncbi:MFS transporter [Salarchaeum sp. III]|uniref:MFS transporter n=1 Tax=Salarchaeum sp. III TaxID=3107927 RepID=UPI002ED7C5A1
MDSRYRYPALYFVFFAAFSGFAAFRNVLLEEMGMSGVEMGIVGMVMIIAGVVVQPLWGVVADYTRSPARVLVVAATVSALALLSYPLGASLSGDAFLLITAGTALFAVGRAPIVPLSNALVLREGFDYGYARSFGSTSFGIAVLVIGFLLAYTTTLLVVYLYIAGMVVFVALALTIPDDEESLLEGSLGTQALGLLARRQFQVVLVAAFLLGFVSRSGDAFFSVYMRAVGLGDGYTGAAWAAKTVAETVVFLAVGRTALSYGSLVSVGGLGFAAGYAGLTLFPTLGSVLLANVGLGIGLALLFFALVNLAHDCAPDGLHSTAQTLLTSVGVGAGGALGHIVAGWLVDAVGVQSMFAYLAAASVLLALVGIAVHAVADSRHPAVA